MSKQFHLEIITHCYNYRRMWSYQISSLRLFPPESIRVTYTLWHTTRADPETARWIERYRSRWWPQSVKFNPRDLSPEQCYNRCIGRNITCRETEADYLFLTDCDVIFGPGCCDGFADGLLEAEMPILAHPQFIYRHKTQQTGDDLIDRTPDRPGWYEIDGSEFVHCRQRRCSGGLFIYRGDVARANGYLDDDEWRHWCKPAPHWIGTRSDKRFREWLNGKLGVVCQPAAIPNMYLLRHSMRGHIDQGIQL